MKRIYVRNKNPFSHWYVHEIVNEASWMQRMIVGKETALVLLFNHKFKCYEYVPCFKSARLVFCAEMDGNWSMDERPGMERMKPIMIEK